MNKRVLVVDDDLGMCEVLGAQLATLHKDIEAVFASNAEDALERIRREDFEVIVTDNAMPGMSGVELCRMIRANRDDIPVVVMTAFGKLDTAVAAIRAGAHDFISKPFNIDEFALTLERAFRDRALREEVKRLRSVVTESSDFGPMIGQSAAMKRMFDLVSRVAETEATCLVTGESGTGKELVVRAIHARSARKDGPFVAINCAAVPETILESELFGHAKGAFTDAHSPRAGLFVQANKGTLLLDEIGELPLGVQAKLLRALQEKRVRPVGEDKEISIDVRVIAATNRDLETEVDERRFREDLFYRINVVRIHVPPLRARGNDMLVLAQHFIKRYAAENRRNVVGLSVGAAEKLTEYPWPGNVRELQNCIERAVALTQFDKIGVDDLPDKLRDYKPTNVVVDSNDPTELLPMSEIERRYIHRVLDAVGGNKTLAAKVLGFDRRTLYRKLGRAEASKDGPTTKDDASGH